MARLEQYNLPAVAIIVDGVTGIDFGDEFAYRITPASDVSTLTVGLDKASTSFGFNQTAVLELAYKPTSTINDQLLTLWQNQQNGSARLFDIAIVSGVNEQIFLSKCSISKAADIEGGGQVMVVREWTLNCENFVPDQSLLS